MKSTDDKAPSAARVAEALKELRELEDYIRDFFVVSYVEGRDGVGQRVVLEVPPAVKADVLSYVAQARSYLTVREVS